MAGPESPRWRPLAAVLMIAGALLTAASVGLRDPVPLFLALPLLLAVPAARVMLPEPARPPRSRFRPAAGSACAAPESTSADPTWFSIAAGSGVQTGFSSALIESGICCRDDAAA